MLRGLSSKKSEKFICVYISEQYSYFVMSCRTDLNGWISGKRHVIYFFWYLVSNLDPQRFNLTFSWNRSVCRWSSWATAESCWVLFKSSPPLPLRRLPVPLQRGYFCLLETKILTHTCPHYWLMSNMFLPFKKIIPWLYVFQAHITFPSNSIT